MFLHLGKNFVIPLKDVIAIVDVASVLNSKDTKDFFKISEEEGFIHDIVEEEIKSYIITERTENDKKNLAKIRKSIIYSSNISSTTLLKRAGFINNIDSV